MNLRFLRFRVEAGFSAEANIGAGNLVGEIYLFVPYDVEALSAVCILVESIACDYDSESLRPLLSSPIYAVLALACDPILTYPLVIIRNLRLTCGVAPT